MLGTSEIRQFFKLQDNFPSLKLSLNLIFENFNIKTILYFKSVYSFPFHLFSVIPPVNSFYPCKNMWINFETRWCFLETMGCFLFSCFYKTKCSFVNPWLVKYFILTFYPCKSKISFFFVKTHLPVFPHICKTRLHEALYMNLCLQTLHRIFS